MKRRKSGGGYRREKAVMIASTALVLSAMTVTGVYVYNNKPKEPEENVVDFSALEQETQEAAEVENRSAKNLTSGEGDSGELDYDPYYARQDALLNGQTANAGAKKTEEGGTAAETESADAPHNVGYAEFGTGADGAEMADGTGLADGDGAEMVDGAGLADGSGAADGAEVADGGGAADGAEVADGTDGQDGSALEAVADVNREEADLHFGEDSALTWPLVGNVLLNYSMDKTIFFPTLQQYKYNPSIVIGATQGADVGCAADGVVESVYEDAKTGTTVVMRLGDGYELTYGQLEEVTVEEGDYVETGAYIGKVAAPTKYYTAEGTNVYFKLTKDGEPVDPMDHLG